jgi:hypothetical protein
MGVTGLAMCERAFGRVQAHGSRQKVRGVREGLTVDVREGELLR